MQLRAVQTLAADGGIDVVPVGDPVGASVGRFDGQTGWRPAGAELKIRSAVFHSAIVLGAAAVLAYGLLGSLSLSPKALVAFAFFSLAAGLSTLLCAGISGGLVLSPASVFYVAAALTLPLPLALLSVVLPGLIDSLKRRTGWLRTSANLANHMLAAAAANALLHVALGHGLPSAAYASAGLVWLLVNVAILSFSVSLSRSIPLSSAMIGEEAVTAELVMVLIGVLTAALYASAPEMIAISAALPLALRRTPRLPLARVEAEQQRRDLERERGRVAELQELQRLRDAFIATVTHDLRSPLTSVSGYAELIGKGEFGTVSEEQQQALRTIERNAGHLLALIEDLLVASHADAEELVVSREAVDLRQILVEVFAAARPECQRLRVELLCDLPDELAVTGDRMRLVQVMTNLVSNAVKYSLPGAAVHVSASSSGVITTVVVSDTGIGMSKADQARLFGRFFRATTAMTHGIHGTGLGLVVVKKIVDAHGGSIVCDSLEGRGTTFTLVLPGAPPAAGCLMVAERQPATSNQQAAA